MPAKSKAVKNAEQRVRQKSVRANAKELRRPSRDDVARMLLWLVISDGHKSGKAGPAFLEGIATDLVEGLGMQGFDDDQSYDVIDALIKKYSTGVFPFQPKPHLETEEPGDLSA